MVIISNETKIRLNVQIFDWGCADYKGLIAKLIYRFKNIINIVL